MNVRVQAFFGAASAFLERSRRVRLIDVLLLAGIVATFFGLVRLGAEWTGAYRPAVEIDLSFGALPRYALLSLSRGLAAYVLSLLFTLGYGYWAAKDKAAERILIPLLDILQSIPVLGFMPGLVLALVAAFPRTNVGLELAAILLIFTGQAWNMTFSYYHSLRSIPPDLGEVGSVYQFGAWLRLRWIELPAAAIGLVWNSMMSMAGGWFFLMVSEAFVMGNHDFRLPGLGSYMSVAAAKGDRPAMLASVVAMVILIVLLDQLLWRPVVVWAQKFRMEESGQAEAMESWFYDLLRHSRLARWLGEVQERSFLRARRAPRKRAAPGRAGRVAAVVLLVLLVGALAWGAAQMIRLLAGVHAADWWRIVSAAALTLVRVLAAVALGTLWTLPAGIAIGLSPRLSRILQPVVQVVASFPAPMLFPAVVLALKALGVSLGIGSVVLMLLGTQWYVLFNVVAGATSIPADLREAASVFGMSRWQRFRNLYFPAVFTYLVTGWVTAAGGAWNASIVSEYMSFGGEVLTARGLGSTITVAAADGDFPVLGAAVAVMALVVVSFNRLVWRRLHAFGEEHFTLSR
ncbi:MAG TPA: ABC transporter permease subunit [Anaeromyxobacter sp.]|nr:ABC transporter permease subunit [Anaeromyxobacter sp.]